MKLAGIKDKFGLIEAKKCRAGPDSQAATGLPLNLTYWGDTKSSMWRDAAPARASI
jgi:hypothetical protein